VRLRMRGASRPSASVATRSVTSSHSVRAPPPEHRGSAVATVAFSSKPSAGAEARIRSLPPVCTRAQAFGCSASSPDRTWLGLGLGPHQPRRPL